MSVYNTHIDKFKVEPDTITITTLGDIKTNLGISTHDICVQHGEKILASQLLLIKDKGYDFAPPFLEMTIHLYLVGVMWRHGESLNLATNPREHALASLHTMLVKKGMSDKSAQKRIEFINNMSRTEDSSDVFAVTAGYQAMLDDNSLTLVLEEYRDEMRVSGALWRFYNRGKKIMLFGGAAAAFIAIWFVTIFIPSSSGIIILAAGVFAAVLVVIPTFLVGTLVYRVKFKKTLASTLP